MALPELLANSSTPGTITALGTLTAEIKNEVGALTLELSAELPASLHGPGQLHLLIDSEIMVVKAAAGLKLTILERAAETTAKAAHGVGEAVYLFLTTGALKLYVQGLIGPWKNPVALATTVELEEIEYSEVGGTILSKKEVNLEIDGEKIKAGQRILIKNQALNTKQDGIYEVIKAGKAGEKWELKRTADALTTAELQDAAVSVEKGTVNEGLTFIQTFTVTTVGTTSQVWRSSGVGGWISLELGAKIEYTTGQTPAARVENNGATVRLRGSPRVKAGEELKVGETLATIHTGLRPPAEVSIPGGLGSASAVQVSIATTGVITLGAAVTSATGCHLDGLTYNLT